MTAPTPVNNTCSQIYRLATELATQKYQTRIAPHIQSGVKKVEETIQANPVLGTAGAGVIGALAFMYVPGLLAGLASFRIGAMIAGAAGGVAGARYAYRTINPNAAVTLENAELATELVQTLEQQEGLSPNEKIASIEVLSQQPGYQDPEVQAILKAYLVELRAKQESIDAAAAESATDISDADMQYIQDQLSEITEIEAPIGQKLDAIGELCRLYPAAKSVFEECAQGLLQKETQRRGL